MWTYDEMSWHPFPCSYHGAALCNCSLSRGGCGGRLTILTNRIFIGSLASKNELTGGVEVSDWYFFHVHPFPSLVCTYDWYFHSDKDRICWIASSHSFIDNLFVKFAKSVCKRFGEMMVAGIRLFWQELDAIFFRIFNASLFVIL
uniref:Uncharacterized protein n=1 Tax=Cacopsylla melanoneura TaxID=428564 RepID=A0A8D9AGH0_9HEMI